MNASLAPADQMQLAVHFHSQGQLDNARTLYEGVLRQFPNDFGVRYHLGLLESQAGDPERAALHFGRAVQANHQNADAQNNLAFTLQQLGRDAEALPAFQQAQALRPTDADIAVNLGLLHKKLQQLPQALACFDQALQSHPQHVALLCNRGNVLQLMGQQGEALACYEQALAIEPDNPVVLCNASNLLGELARYPDALACADRATRAHPGHAQAWVERGNALKLLDRTADAVASFEKALQIDPVLVQAHTSLAATVLSDSVDTGRAIEAGRQSLTVFLQSTYLAPRLRHTGLNVSSARLKHDVQQAHWLAQHGHDVPGLAAFLKTGEALLRKVQDPAATRAVHATPAELARMQTFLSAPWVHAMPSIPDVLNPANDWPALEDAYLAGTPEILTIDKFLSDPALKAFQDFAHASRVWHGEYANNYLGAFANRGFNSPLHLQLARELKQRMPRVFQDYLLTQLWGFKYEPAVTRGINVHADFAKVNLNFWIAPSKCNLDPDSGGLKVYDVPAPEHWTFEQYNIDSALIYSFLEQHQAKCVTVPHRCNRAVLFNSALFHETDTIRFVDSYESRRVNMTYLFGRQLR
ncbi:tetratricopeptide repeat protein [Hydrogenophaga sp.]|uniref:tetratricopeptide repeat protein n=1 Tax=Hydrogenophaga sp. TaxID=1904254 RepID=UPI00271AD37E|nr:tetratricopeptide repeat protein [Hydrogenophaga sp.]MDO9134750.1 tetratricopeptide repeat protein [Hydrogenophaga sp.]